MYNTDFLPQLEEARRHIFGTGSLGMLASVDPQAAAEVASRMPLNLPKDTKYFHCEPNEHGEYVPVGEARTPEEWDRLEAEARSR